MPTKNIIKKTPRTTPKKHAKPKSLNETQFIQHPKIAENYNFIIHQFMEWISSHLCDCSRTFNGDLTEMVVLAVIGQMLIRHNANEAARNYALDGEELSISISRISELTSIPRETVRRKLLGMKRKGWVEQGENGRWKFVMNGNVSAVSIDVKPLETRSLTRMMNLVDAINNHIKK